MFGSKEVRRQRRPWMHADLGWKRRGDPGRRMSYDVSCPGELVDRLWEDPDSLIDDGLRLRPKHTVRSVAFCNLGGQKLVIKRYVERSARHRVKSVFVASRAEKAVRDSLAVASAGVPTPHPLAFRNCFWGPLQRPVSYFAYRYQEGETLAAFLESWRATSNCLERIGTQAKMYWRKLSFKGLLLHDPNQHNFLIDRSLRLWVIDVDRLERYRDAKRLESLADQSLRTFLKFQPAPRTQRARAA